MLHGYSPYKGVSLVEICQNVVNNDVKFSPGINENAKELIRSILTQDANFRPTIDQILKHKFLAQSLIQPAPAAHQNSPILQKYGSPVTSKYLKQQVNCSFQTQNESYPTKRVSNSTVKLLSSSNQVYSNSNNLVTQKPTNLMRYLSDGKIKDHCMASINAPDPNSYYYRSLVNSPDIAGSCDNRNMNTGFGNSLNGISAKFCSRANNNVLSERVLPHEVVASSLPNRLKKNSLLQSSIVTITKENTNCQNIVNGIQENNKKLIKKYKSQKMKKKKGLMEKNGDQVESKAREFIEKIGIN